jgi:hypothetical protein
MKTMRTWAVWWRWLRRSPARPRRKPDFGDHGTAFGLDLSLEQERRPVPVLPKGR